MTLSIFSYAYWATCQSEDTRVLYNLGEMSIHIFSLIFHWAICLSDVLSLSVLFFLKKKTILGDLDADAWMDNKNY